MRTAVALPRRLQPHRCAGSAARATTCASLSICMRAVTPIHDRLYKLSVRQHTLMSDIRRPRRALATLPPARIRHGTSPQTPQQRVRSCKRGEHQPPGYVRAGPHAGRRLRARRDAYTRRTHAGHTHAPPPRAMPREARPDVATVGRLRPLPAAAADPLGHGSRRGARQRREATPEGKGFR